MSIREIMMLNIYPRFKGGAKEFVGKLAKKYDVKLFTTRPKELAYNWLINNELDKYIKEITNVKIPAWLLIDDRCIQFNGNYIDLYDSIEKFNVWYKK